MGGQAASESLTAARSCELNSGLMEAEQVTSGNESESVDVSNRTDDRAREMDTTVSAAAAAGSSASASSGSFTAAVLRVGEEVDLQGHLALLEQAAAALQTVVRWQ